MTMGGVAATGSACRGLIVATKVIDVYSEVSITYVKVSSVYVLITNEVVSSVVGGLVTRFTPNLTVPGLRLKVYPPVIFSSYPSTWH